jgi:hypothetical protein
LNFYPHIRKQKYRKHNLFAALRIEAFIYFLSICIMLDRSSMLSGS